MDEQLDDALERLPVWEPPAGFAPRMAALAVTRLEVERRQSRTRVWAWNAAYGTTAATVGLALGWAVRVSLEPYLRIMTAAADVMVMQPVAVSWTCATLSLVTAFVFVRRELA